MSVNHTCQTFFHAEWKDKPTPTVTDSVMDPLSTPDGWKRENQLIVEGTEAEVGVKKYSKMRESGKSLSVCGYK